MSKEESNLMMDKMWINSKRRTFENCYFFAMTISLTGFLILMIGKIFNDVEMDDQTRDILKCGVGNVLMVLLMVVFVKLGACCKWKQEWIIYIMNILALFGVFSFIGFMLAIMQMVKHKHDIHVDILFMSQLVPWTFAIYFVYITFNTDTYNLHGSIRIEAPNSGVRSEHAACGHNCKVKSKSGGAGNNKTKSKSGGAGLKKASATSSYGSTSQLSQV